MTIDEIGAPEPRMPLLTATGLGLLTDQAPLPAPSESSIQL